MRRKISRYSEQTNHHFQLSRESINNVDYRLRGTDGYLYYWGVLFFSTNSSI